MMDVVLVMLGVFVIAFAFAPLGLGGGMLFVPLLHYALDEPIDGTTLAISLALTWAVSIGSGARHRREGFYDKDATMSTLYGAVVGALIGVGVVNALGNDLDASFKLISVFVLVWALVKTWRKQRDEKHATPEPQRCEGERDDEDAKHHQNNVHQAGCPLPFGMVAT